MMEGIACHMPEVGGYVCMKNNPADCLTMRAEVLSLLAPVGGRVANCLHGDLQEIFR